MDRLVADYGRMAELVGELDQLVKRLDLGESHYLRAAMRVDVTGSQDVSDACRAFEDEWAFGRDRLMSTLRRLIEFLGAAASEYGETDAQLAIDAMTIGMTDAAETTFRAQLGGTAPAEF